MLSLSRVGAAALCAAALLGSAGAEAQGVEDWRYRAALYGYFPSIGATTTFPGTGGGGGVSVDAADILDSLEFAFMATFEAKKGLWGVYSDLVYFNVGNTKTQSRSLSLGDQGLPADVTADVKLDMKSVQWMLAGTYQAVATPRYTLDLLVGARLLDVDAQLDWTLGGNIGSVPLPDHAGSSSVGLSNWDAIVGVKGRAMFGDDGRWFVPYHFDVGAGESRLTWQAAVGLGYTYPWGDIVAAWRYLDYDMKSGTALESINFSGPAIAVGFRW
jgi:hypothetical protein